MKLSEIIDIPERVHQGDFVLRLTEGVEHAQETLADYVVTEPVARAFDDALGFISVALKTNSSKACYLHGSFGSGKSHFMAVLNLLLHGDPKARSIPELAPAIKKHETALEKKKFMLVPYHMIAEPSMEAAILGRYVEFIRRTHPEAPVPGVYLGERLFEDAKGQRTRDGDERFFTALNRGKKTSAGWGQMAAGWTAERFEKAMRAPAGDADRQRLIGDLVSVFFTSYSDVARDKVENFLPLDDGLAVISQHAKHLGFDGVILFLDELMLWLASRATDVDFLHREGQKLVKLCEATRADRPIPIIAFVARQRDLRELVGDHIAGAEKLRFADTLKHWEGRFHLINLETKSLPAIAKRRLLRPKSEAAARALDDAFKKTQGLRREVRDVLFGQGGDEQAFRDLYPFSPILVDTLVSLSSALQRQRTALRIMLQILVNERDRLDAEDIIPVGDLYDALSEGIEPFSEDLRQQFEAARRLYDLKFVPYLSRLYGKNIEALRALPKSDAHGRAFRNDDRLIKTLILAALVPDIEAFRELNGKRLAALNWGGIKSPIQGKEGAEITQKLRAIAADVGELKIGGDERDPTFSVRITGVDTEGVLAKADSVDNDAGRRSKVREILFAALGIDEKVDLFASRHTFDWRGSKRSVDVVYENVRTMSQEALRPAGDDWKVVIDYPFDDPGFTPKDDVENLATMRGRKLGWRTVAWLPNFLSRNAQKDLGTLVKIDHVLSGNLLEQSYGAHISPLERKEVREILDGQRSALRARLRQALEVAYGLRVGAASDMVDEKLEPEDLLQTLDGSLSLRPVAAANMAEAFQGILDRLMTHSYPHHPVFKRTITKGDLRRVLAILSPFYESGEKRLVPPLEDLRLLADVAMPLGLGQAHEQAYLPSDDWTTHFWKVASQNGMKPTVGALRASIDLRRGPMGITKEMQCLLILLFATSKQMSFRFRGGPHAASIDNLPDEVELSPEELPDAAVWKVAAEKMTAIFGGVWPARPTAAKLGEMQARFDEEVREKRDVVAKVHTLLRRTAVEFGVSESADRIRTAAAAMALFEGIAGGKPADRPGELARLKIPTTIEALAKSISSAKGLVGEVERFNAKLVLGLDQFHDDRRAAALAVIEDVRRAIAVDELAQGLAGVLSNAEARATDLMTKKTVIAPPPVVPPPLPAVVVPVSPVTIPDAGGAKNSPEWVAVSDGRETVEGADALRRLAERLTAEVSKVGRRLSIQWTIEKDRKQAE